LAVEQYLDPVSNGFAKAYVTSVARTELEDRPVDGLYVVEFETPPEVRLERIERVQVLAESTYWVSQ
jgi:hypothetical protein